MERAFLEDQLGAGRSLEQIGRLVGKHPSTVGYWLKKHGLVAAHHAKYAPRGTVDPQELAELVALGLTRAELIRKLGVSGSTVSYWLRKLQLRTARAEVMAETLAARRSAVRVLPRHCRKHGLVDFRITRRGTYECVRCKSEAVARRRRRVKRILVRENGGCCRRCGFAEHPAALQFHHVDPAAKSFALSSEGVTRALAKAREEARKCVLLCANCHALVEAGVTTV